MGLDVSEHDRAGCPVVEVVDRIDPIHGDPEAALAPRADVVVARSPMSAPARE